MGIFRAFRRWEPVVLAVLLPGCAAAFQGDWTDALVWSPDGRRAAVITQGLYLSDAEGTLSPLLAADVYRAAWLHDSQRLILARSREVTSFAEIVAALDPERGAALVAEAERLWREAPVPGEPGGEDGLTLPFTFPLSVIAIYLRDRYGNAFDERFTDDDSSADAMTAELHSLVVASVTGDRLEPGVTLYTGLTTMRDIRPAPGDAYVAFTTEMATTRLEDVILAGDKMRTFVVRVDGAAPAALVDSGTATSPDWTPGGQSLVYLQSYRPKDSNIGFLGCLAERKLFDASGSMRVAEQSSCLVQLIFDDDSRVRCAGDGRVLFDAREFRFPRVGETPWGVLRIDGNRIERLFTYDGPDARRLFAFDPGRSDAPLSPVIPADHLTGDVLGFFEVSPDGSRVIFGTGKGVMRLLTLADGRTELLPFGLFDEEGYTLRELPRASWSGPGAFTYVKRVGARSEFVLRNGASEVVLSRNWPDALVYGLLANPPDNPLPGVSR